MLAANVCSADFIQESKHPGLYRVHEGPTPEKKDLLRNYRDDYAHRFRSAAQNGIGQREWHNFQEFLNRLDEAIELQAQAVAQHERHTALGQRNWQEQRKKLRAFDTLAERHARSEAQREQKSEQKQQDEIAARRRREDS